jgi:hypothetical protein
VRNRLNGNSVAVIVAAVLLLVMTSLALGQAAPQAGGQAGGGGRGGRGGGRGGANAAPAEATPRFSDGTVNLGRVPGEKGIWGLPYITNMAQNSLENPGRGGGGRGGAAGRGGGGGRGAGAAPAGATAGLGGPLGGGEGTRGGGQRGGAASEPWIPFQPWSAAVYNYNSLNESKYDPEGYCLPPGGPRLYATPYPMEIIQSPETKRIWMVFEGGTHVWREIYMDGRPHPTLAEIKGQTWLGHSVGHWEGDTLVVDVIGFNEGTWLDYFGHPHTELLHVVEKFSRPNKNTLHYEATIDDPGAYSKPWTTAWDIPWRPTEELQEYICQENNRFLNRLKDDLGESVIRH